jgi:hypothetical protein
MRAILVSAALLASAAVLAVAPLAHAQESGGNVGPQGCSAGIGSPAGSAYPGANVGGLPGYPYPGVNYGLGPGAAGSGALSYITAYPSTTGYDPTGCGVPIQVTCLYPGQIPPYC